MLTSLHPVYICPVTGWHAIIFHQSTTQINFLVLSARSTENDHGTCQGPINASKSNFPVIIKFPTCQICYAPVNDHETWTHLYTDESYLREGNVALSYLCNITTKPVPLYLQLYSISAKLNYHFCTAFAEISLSVHDICCSRSQLSKECKWDETWIVWIDMLTDDSRTRHSRHGVISSDFEILKTDIEWYAIYL